MIERGMGVSQISQKLHDEKVISNPLLFKIAARVFSKSLKAGEYEFPVRISMKAALRQLGAGEIITRRFTIREGLTSYETVRLINGLDNLSGEIKSIPSEGTLLPNTYDYQLGESRAAIITRLETEMENAILNSCNILLEKIAASTLTDMMERECPTAPKPLKNLRDVLTLASIVEKETAVADERAKVAGVFLNRLNKGMALQTDPTVIYAITKGKHKNDGKGPLGRRLLRKDLKIDNPYNTYKYAGLPPGPIANPGKDAIEAVINPQQHDYLFFVADGTGGHAFGRNLAEHNANVKKWRKIRSQK